MVEMGRIYSTEHCVVERLCFLNSSVPYSTYGRQLIYEAVCGQLHYVLKTLKRRTMNNCRYVQIVMLRRSKTKCMKLHIISVGLQIKSAWYFSVSQYCSCSSVGCRQSKAVSDILYWEFVILCNPFNSILFFVHISRHWNIFVSSKNAWRIDELRYCFNFVWKLWKHTSLYSISYVALFIGMP